MTASFNISFLGSPEQAEGSASKKNYRSSKYNNAGEREQSSSLELPSVRKIARQGNEEFKIPYEQ